MSGDRPWMKFYPRDWRGDQALRAVSLAARGFWMECLCIMHEAKPYGHLLLNGETVGDVVLARMTGTSVDEAAALMAELRQAGVLSMTRGGVITSRRMIKDEAASKKGAKAINKRWSQVAETEEENTGPNRSPKTKAFTHMPDSREQKDSSLRSLSPAQAPERTTLTAQKRKSWKNDDHESFDEFWSVYPRKENRKPASQAFSKAISAGADPRTVIDGARRYAEFVAANGTEMQFIAQASTWLNQERWTNAYRIEHQPRGSSGDRATSSNPRLAQALGSLRDRGRFADPLAGSFAGDEGEPDGRDSVARARAVFAAHVAGGRRGAGHDGCIDGDYEVR